MLDEVQFEMALVYLRKKILIEQRIKTDREKAYNEKISWLYNKGKDFKNFDLEYNQMNEKQKKEAFDQAWKHYQ